MFSNAGDYMIHMVYQFKKQTNDFKYEKLLYLPGVLLLWSQQATKREKFKSSVVAFTFKSVAFS